MQTQGESSSCNYSTAFFFITFIQLLTFFFHFYIESIYILKMINPAIVAYGVALMRDADPQTPEMCLSCVRHDGTALRWVKVQIPEICLAAVKQNGGALAYVKNKTPEICMAAIAQDQDAAMFVLNSTAHLPK
jgi:hypothetical protein